MKHLDVLFRVQSDAAYLRGAHLLNLLAFFGPSVLSIHLWCRPLRVAPSRRHGLRRARPRGSRRGATQRRIQVRVTSASHPRPVLAPRPHRALMPHASTCPLRDLSADLRRVLPFRLRVRLRRRQSNVRTRAAPSTASIATSSLSDTPPDAPADPYAALKGCTVHHAPTGELVDLATRIDTSPGQTTVVAFMRSFG